MIVSRSTRPRLICGSLATIALAFTLTACGTGANAGSGTNTLTLPTPTKVAVAAASAVPSAPAPPPSAAVAAPAATTSTYSGARWQGLPTPGTVKLHQEEPKRYSIFVTGSQQAVMTLYSDAFLADGWVQTAQSGANGSQFFTFARAGRSIIVAVGPDLGTDSVIVVIDATL